MNIEHYLGFTDNLKEPRKTNTQDVLEKRYRYNEFVTVDGISNPILSRKDFVVNSLILGYTVDFRPNVTTYNQRTHEPNKQRDEYWLNKKDSNESYPITKTEYEFFLYCQNKGFLSLEAVNKYLQTEHERKIAQEQAEAEESKLRALEEKQKCLLEEKLKSEIEDEVNRLPVEDISLADTIFLDKQGMAANPRVYELIVLIRRINEPYCRKEVISRLTSNDNVASRCLFECITGISLPSTQKSRIAYLEKVIPSDFLGRKAYIQKRRLKPGECYFYMNYSLGREKSVWKRAIGIPYSRYDYEFFIREAGCIELTEKKSGCLIFHCDKVEEIEQKLDELVNELGIEEFKNKLAYMEERAVMSAGPHPDNDEKTGLSDNDESSDSVQPAATENEKAVQKVETEQEITPDASTVTFAGFYKNTWTKLSGERIVKGRRCYILVEVNKSALVFDHENGLLVVYARTRDKALSELSLVWEMESLFQDTYDEALKIAGPRPVV